MPTNRRTSSNRCGSVYLAVTGVAMILSLIGFTAIHITRLELRMTGSSQDQSKARLHAMSAVELALSQVEEYPDWRTDFTHGVKYEMTPNLYGSPLYFKLLDNENGNRDGGDGDLADDATEAVEIQGVGRSGNAVAIFSVAFAPATHELKSYTDEINSSNGEINNTEWYGQYFLPTLPAVATSWTVTSIEVKIKRDGNPLNQLDVSLHLPNDELFHDDLYPGTHLETLAVSTGDLPDSHDWHEFTFSNVTSLDPKVGLCLTLASEDSKSAKFIYESSNVTEPNAHMLTGGNGNWTSLHADESLYYRIHGYYTTANSGAGAFTLTPGSWKTAESP